MSLDTSSREISGKPEKGFFDLIREGWQNLKDFLSEKFSAIKDTLSNLNILKRDVSGSSQNSGSSSVRESAEVNHNSIKEKLTQICVRSRQYGDVNKNDVGYVSFGKLQFHGANAKKILRNIKANNPSRFNSIMTDPLFRDTDVACTSVRNDNHVSQFRELMKDSSAKREMDKVVDEVIEGYLTLTKRWGVSDPRATLAFGRICNYGPKFAENIKDIMVKNGKNIDDYNQVIDCYEANTSGGVQGKFRKPDAALGNKNIREFIGECWA